MIVPEGGLIEKVLIDIKEESNPVDLLIYLQMLRDSFKVLFEKLLGKKVTVDKKREIYSYEGTQIHLDVVQNLGTFIEFERKIKNVKKDYKVLEELMKELSIEEKDLIRESYSDLLEST